jgi:dTDP-4-dehydrorhamnose reductase
MGRFMGNKKCCMVMGATGMLGRAVMGEAAEHFESVVGVARSNAEITLDLADAEATEIALTRLAPALVINAAAITSLDACARDPGLALRVNARSVAVVADYCRRYSCRLVQISTDHFFTGDSNIAHDEMAPVSLVNDYARSKFAGEAFALAVPSSLVIRTNVTGRRGQAERPTLIEWLLAQLEAGAPITGFTDYFASTLDSGTLAKAILDLIRREHTGIYNVASRDIASKFEFLASVARLCGHPDDRIEPGCVGALATPRAESCGLDVRKAERDLGYRLPNLAQVVAKLVEQMAVPA